MNKSDVRKQVAQIQMQTFKMLDEMDENEAKFLTQSLGKIEQTAKHLMRDTATNPQVSYGKREHHPSLPYNAPAPDTGTLLQSITHSIEKTENGKYKGEVGSILSNPDYPRFLEYGTSKMKPRPWLSTAVMKCQDWISQLFKELLGKK